MAKLTARLAIVCVHILGYAPVSFYVADRKHWLPLNHDINSDHELWEMTDKLGDRSLRIWLEFLSIADRNNGVLPSMSDSFASTIGRKCHSTQTKVRQVWDHAHAMLWLVSDPSPRTRNHAKYHPTRSLASDTPTILPTILPTKEKNNSATPTGFAEFWLLYPKKRNKKDAERVWKRLHPDEALRTIIEASIRTWLASPEWLKDGGQFIPYPARWLRANGWEDQGNGSNRESLKEYWERIKAEKHGSTRSNR